jgi:hypothetical protein
VEKHVLGFCAGIEHKKLLIKKLFQVFNFVLLMNYVFIWCCSGMRAKETLNFKILL